MKTKEITAAQFSATFGTDRIVPGSFSYFFCDNGIGIIRDNHRKSIEIVTNDASVPTDISYEEELVLLSLVCGEFQEEIVIPAQDTLEDYETREKHSRRPLYAMWIGYALFVAICILVLLLVYR